MRILLVSLALFALPAQADDFDCTAATAGGAGEKAAAAQELMAQTWDTARLGCGANTLIALADARVEDPDAQLAALRANATYIYFLDRIVLYELGYLIVSYTTDVPQEKMVNQPMIDLMAAQEEQVRLLKRAGESGFDDPEIHYFEALTKGPTADAMPILEFVVEADPPGLEGAAHAMLGEVLYALPDLAGGDLDRAIELMREAHRRAPDNPLYARLLAAYLLDIDATQEARDLLGGMLKADPEKAGLQLQSDQLRIAADIAGRIPDEALAARLDDARADMLAAHPYLENRKVVAALGHFGDKDPMED